MRPRNPTIAAAVLIAALAATNIYRAATSSLTVDEAVTRICFVDHPWSDFSANHHVLNTYLVGLSVRCFGDNELAIRLFPLIAGLVFMAGAWKLAEMMLGNSWHALVILAALVLNPLQLDYMILARGYGLGCAALVWAMIYLRRSKYAAASTCLALAVASNLTMLYPAVGLGIATLATMGRKDIAKNIVRLAVPGAVVLVALLAPLTQRILRQQYDWGHPRMPEALHDVTNAAFAYHIYPWSGAASAAFGDWVFLGVLVASLGYLIFACYSPSSSRREVVVAAGALAVTAGLLVLARYAKHLPYPGDRTGIYFFLLATAAVVGMAQQWTAARRVVLGVAGVAALLFAVQFTIHGFYYDRPSEGIKEAAARLPQDRAAVVLIDGEDPINAWNWYASKRRYPLRIVGRNGASPRTIPSGDTTEAPVFIRTSRMLDLPVLCGSDVSRQTLYAPDDHEAGRVRSSTGTDSRTARQQGQQGPG